MPPPAEKLPDAAAEPKTLDDLRAAPPDKRYELIDGVLEEKAAPSAEHGTAQSWLGWELGPKFSRRGGGGRGPGGWWLMAEVEVQLGENVFRPDMVGWRRDRVPERPTGSPVPHRPDWVAEVLSPSNAANDTVLKLRRYHQAGIPHYWIVDPESKSLLVYRSAPEGYAVVKSAQAGDIVRLEPFDAIELRVGLLFGEDPDDPPGPPPAP